jgi:hypothetical protein
LNIEPLHLQQTCGYAGVKSLLLQQEQQSSGFVEPGHAQHNAIQFCGSLTGLLHKQQSSL